MLVSVITPVGPRWNPDWLLAGHAALVQGNATSVEHLVVCDGADPDAVAEVLPRAQVLGGLDSHGPARARNLGLSLASGDWVYSLDADDLPEPGGVDGLLAAATASPGRGWAAGPSVDVAEDGITITYTPDPALTPWSEAIPLNGFLETADATGTYPVLCSGATLLRRTLAQSLGGWDARLNRVSEDVALVAAISAVSEGGWMDQPVLRYRKHSSSLTAQAEDPGLESIARDWVRERAARAASTHLAKPVR